MGSDPFEIAISADCAMIAQICAVMPSVLRSSSRIQTGHSAEIFLSASQVSFGRTACARHIATESSEGASRVR
jgi:hypothetical protein